MPNGITVAKAFVEIVPTMEGAQQTITNEMAKAGAAGEKAGKAAGSSYNDAFSSTATKAGAALTAAVTVPIVSTGKKAISAASEFESSVAKVATLLDDDAMGSIDELTDKIMALSTETGVAAADIAEGVYGAISAGRSAGDAVEFVAKTVKLAKGGFTDVASATDVMSKAMNAYGMSVEDADHVSDVLIATQNAGITTVDALSKELGKVIPAAKTAGVSLEEVATIYGGLTKGGINISDVSTGTKAMFVELTKLGSKAQKAWEFAAGESFDAYMSEGHTVLEAMQLLQAHAEKYGMSIGDLFGNVTGGNIANAMVQYATLMDESAEIINHADGLTEAAAAKIDATSAHEFAKYQNDLNNALIKLGNDILPIVVPLVETLGKWVHAAAEWWSKQPKIVKDINLGFLGMAALAGPLLLLVGTGSKLLKFTGSMGKFGKAAGNAGTSLALLGEDVGGTTNMFGGLAGQALKLVAVGVAFLLIAKGIKLIAEAAIEMKDAGPDAWLNLIGLAVGVGIIMFALAKLAPALTAGISGVIIFCAVVVIIGAVCKVAGKEIAEIIRAVGELVDAVGRAVKLICEGIGTVVDSIFNGITSIVDALTNRWQVILDGIAGIFDSIGSAAEACGRGFHEFSDAVVNLTNQTSVVDLGSTLKTVGDGVSYIIKSCSGHTEAFTGISQLGLAFLNLGTDATTGVLMTTTALSNLQHALENTNLTMPGISTRTYGNTANTSSNPVGNMLYRNNNTVSRLTRSGTTVTDNYGRPVVSATDISNDKIVGALDDIKGLIKDDTTRTINHTGTIRIEGINDRGQLEQVVQLLARNMRAGVRMA